MTRLAAPCAGALALTLSAGSMTAGASSPRAVYDDGSISRSVDTAGTAAATVPITVSGLKAGTQVEVTVEITGAGAPVTGAAGGNGMLDMLSDVGAGGKPHIQLSVEIGDQCVDGRVRIAMVQNGADPRSIALECRRRAAGLFWLDTVQHLTINVANATLTIDETASLDVDARSSKGMGKGKKVGIVVLTGAGAAALATALGGGGSASTSTASTPPVTPPTATTPPPVVTPTPGTATPPTTPPTAPPSVSTGGGTYVIVIVVSSDGNGHRMFVGYESVTTVVIVINGSNITISGAGPWVPVNGTIDLDSGRFTASGSGTIAGRNNVPVAVDGTLTLTETAGIGAFATQANTSFNVVVGGGGSLPGSVDDGKIRYSATGRRQ